MSYNLVNPTTGDLTRVAGLSGELVPSVALQQSGTVTFSCEANSWTTVDVTFATPMPDTDYLVVTDSGETAYVHVQNATIKQTTGFTMIVWNRDAVSNTGIIRWTAFKLMTDTVHEADAAHIAQNTANFAPAFSEVTSYAVGDYVTYNNVLYRCTTAHTAGVWVAGHFTAVTVGDEITHPHAIKESTHTSSLNVTTTKIDVDSATFTSTRSGKLLVMANNIHYTKNGAYQLVLSLEVGSQRQEILSVASGEGVANGCAIFNVEANQVNTVKITALLSGADSSTSATVGEGYSNIQITMVIL